MLPGKDGRLNRSRAEVWTPWLVFGCLLALCFTVALTQEVNAFPTDGWFSSQYHIFQRSPGADNFTPIAAPAYMYFATHAFAAMLNLDLQAEFYLVCLVQNFLIFLTAFCLYQAHRLLGIGTMGLVVSAIFVILIESTLLAQAFWSENISLFLMGLLVLCCVRIVVRVGDARRSLLAWALLLGLTLGLLVITRMVPIVLVPGLAWLFRHRLERHAARLASATVILCVLGLTVGAMSANLWRFDRFELSNSMGRHLWQNISPRADEMLEDSKEYQKLKRADPAIVGKRWWEVLRDPGPDFQGRSREELLRTLSFQAISAHPLMYLGIGIENTGLLLREGPNQIGRWRGGHYNPLNRTSMLPPLLGPLPQLEEWLGRIQDRSLGLWPFIAYGTLLAWVLGELIGKWSLTSTRSVAKTFGLPAGLTFNNGRDPCIAVGRFLAFALVGQLWLTAQIEAALGRYQIPFFPVFALLMSITLHSWTRLAAELTDAGNDIAA